MKKITVLTLALTMSSSFAAQEYAGINFHSSVPQDQVNAIKSDLNYLYKTKITKPEPLFLAMSEMEVADGPNMHNWLLNRSRYIVGETFELEDSNVVVNTNHRFPSTPLPMGFGMMEGREEVTTVMSNIGSALYLIGKKENLLFGINFDGTNVFAKSPRTGILKVGRGLFLEKFAINKVLLSPANSVSRLGTLFHEARHSDGNSAHTAYTHATCPIGHPYAGHAACEATVNGPYSIGAVSEVHMIKNCSSCSTQDISALSARAADSFNRIVDVRLLNLIGSLKNQIKTYNDLIVAYEDLAAKYPNRAHTIELELKKVKTKKAQMEARLAILEQTKPSTPALNPAPEGDFALVSLKDSIKLMEKSLKKF